MSEKETPHPVTGKATQQYSISGGELLAYAANKFEFKTGVIELVWDDARKALIVKHSPGA